MLLCFISLNFIALLPNIIALRTLPEYGDSYITFSPSKAKTLTFAFIDAPEIEKLLLNPQEDEDPDEEPGNTLPPN